MPPRPPRVDRDRELVVLAGELLDGLDEFTDAVVAQIRVKVPYYGSGDHVSFEDNRHAVRTNVERVLRAFHGADPPDVSAARETGRARGEEGVPLPMVMAAFRVGFNGIWTNLLLRARTRPQVSQDVLLNAASEIWEMHDTFADAMADAYRTAVFAGMIRGEQERSALVAALLEGHLTDQVTGWEVADVLRLPARGPFVVVVAEVVQVAQEVLTEAESKLRARGIPSAWRLLPDAQVGIVRLADEQQLALLGTELTRLARARVGVSPTYTRVVDTSSALRLARMALATAPPGSAAVRRFDEHPLGIAAVNASAAMGRVVRTVLGPVLDQPEQDRAVLLATLRAWRDNHGSTDGAAHQLYCHPNTVRLRLRRVEAATGRLLADPRGAAEILLALESVESGSFDPDA